MKFHRPLAGFCKLNDIQFSKSCKFIIKQNITYSFTFAFYEVIMIPKISKIILQMNRICVRIIRYPQRIKVTIVRLTVGVGCQDFKNNLFHQVFKFS